AAADGRGRDDGRDGALTDGPPARAAGGAALPRVALRPRPFALRRALRRRVATVGSARPRPGAAVGLARRLLRGRGRRARAGRRLADRDRGRTVLLRPHGAAPPPGRGGASAPLARRSDGSAPLGPSGPAAAPDRAAPR